MKDDRADDRRRTEQKERREETHEYHRIPLPALGVEQQSLISSLDPKPRTGSSAPARGSSGQQSRVIRAGATYARSRGECHGEFVWISRLAYGRAVDATAEVRQAGFSGIGTSSLSHRPPGTPACQRACLPPNVRVGAYLRAETPFWPTEMSVSRPSAACQLVGAACQSPKCDLHRTWCSLPTSEIACQTT